MQETQVWSLGLEDPMEKGMATHARILAWRILWTEEPDRLQSTGSQRVRHNWMTNTTNGRLEKNFPFTLGLERRGTKNENKIPKAD